MSYLTFLIGILFIIAGLYVLTLVRSRFGVKALELQFAVRTSIAGIRQAFFDAERLGRLDEFVQYVEIEGVLATDEQVVTPFTEKEVAYYEADMTELYEIDTGTKKDGSSIVSKREKKRESFRSQAKLYIEDAATGDRIPIAGGARMDVVPTYTHTEPVESASNIGYFLSHTYESSGSRTIAYRMREKTLPLNQTVYVLGEITETDRELTLRASTNVVRPFMVSRDSAVLLIKNAKLVSVLALIGGVALVFTGMMFLFNPGTFPV